MLRIPLLKRRWMLHKRKEIRTKENIMKEENYKIRKIWKMERRVKKIMDVVDVVRDLDVLFVHFKIYF